MAVKSLVELCTIVCIQNIKDITDVGGAPYMVLRPILMKIDNAKQLRQIEEASPHLERDTGECWQRLIGREFRALSEKHKFEPRNPRSWHKVYEKYKRMDDEQKAEAQAKLKQALNKINSNKKANTSRVVDYDSHKLTRLPRDVRNGAGPRRTGPGGARAGDSSELRFSGGSRTKTNTPKSIIKKAYREAKEIRARNSLNTPTGQLASRPGQIAQAPKGMVQDMIHKARPAMGIRPPSARPDKRENPEVAEREARLRRLKGTPAKKEANYMDDDELDNELGLSADYEDEYHGSGVGGGGLNEDNLEELFDDPPAKPTATATKSSSHATKSTSTMSKKPASSTPASTATPITGAPLRKGPGVLARKFSGSALSLAPAPSSLSLKPASRSPTTSTSAASLPKHQTAPAAAKSPSSASPPPTTTAGASKPGPSSVLARKRKPADVFMRPKKAARR
ncbi:RNA polymerase II transcription factor SIII subunit A-domain-containing protein [Xylariomycetidae sp. FL0641]|nr:RNA polymerase II transcription factor SIII subunit A-domain-containing protein [Xylariomycetidae sp. FL0641]